MADDLVSRLRACSHCDSSGQDPDCPRKRPCDWCKLDREAADVIERLGTELSKCTWHSAIDEATEDAAVLYRERDEARRELETCFDVAARAIGSAYRNMGVVETLAKHYETIRSENAELRAVAEHLASHAGCSVDKVRDWMRASKKSP
jgi:hypothetical protein